MGIDDGSRSLEESIKLLKIQEEKGITDIILTPHYIENTDYTCSIKQKKDIIKELKKQNKYIDINIFTAFENVNLDKIVRYVKDGEEHTFLEEYDKDI